VIPGVNGIPLSYAVRKNDKPTDDLFFSIFNKCVVSRAPLKTVLEGGCKESPPFDCWLCARRTLRELDTIDCKTPRWLNWCDCITQPTIWLLALCKEKAWRIGYNWLQNTKMVGLIWLHYATTMQEKATKFVVLHMQRRFNCPYITKPSVHFLSTGSLMCYKRRLQFSKKKTSPCQKAKVNKLLTKVQYALLSVSVAHLCYQLNISGISFTVAGNHRNFKVLQTPAYQMARKTGATNMGGTQNGLAGRGVRRQQNRGQRIGHSSGCNSCDKVTWRLQ
jgi:hypothetical protein